MNLKIRLKHASTLEEVDILLQQINEKSQVLKRVERLQESNPMLGPPGNPHSGADHHAGALHF